MLMLLLMLLLLLFVILPRMQQAIVLQNACFATADQASCEQVFFGVLKKGMYAALQTYTSLVLDVLSRRGVASGDAGVVRVSAVAMTARGCCFPY
jgi:hypothetical protein